MRIITRMNIGGPALQVSMLMHQLNTKEFDHRLYTGNCSTTEANYSENILSDISTTVIDSFGQDKKFYDQIKTFIFLVKEIRRFKPDIIHTHTAKAGLLGRVASVVSLKQSIRIHTFHGHLLYGYFGPTKKLFVILTERILAKFTHKLIAVGINVRNDLLNVGIGSKEQFLVIPPGLNISNLYSKFDAKKFYNLDPSRLHCAFVGRVTQIKRIDRFLEVVEEIKKRNIDLDFFIAGDGELLENCKRIIMKKSLPVKMLGWQHDIEKVLSAADILIVTSDNEGTPTAIIQAGLASLPVVATKVGSIPEVIIDGVTGVLTSFEVLDIADSIERLVRNQTLRLTMGGAAKQFTQQNFGISKFTESHINLYKSVLNI
jgi:glycosyltransferase involved in cell wall biosynthesis